MIQHTFKYTMSRDNAKAIWITLHKNSAVFATLSKNQVEFVKKNNHLFDVKRGMSFQEWRIDQQIRFKGEA